MKVQPNTIILKLLVCFFLFAPNFSVLNAQPYTITAYIDSSVVTPSDVSTLQSITYVGQGMNWVFDRRVDDWVLINTYLFDVFYDDALTSQVQVNPEFGSVLLATLEAEKYAFIIGQLPACLRSGIDKIWIHLGTESFGGGFDAVLIHTGQSVEYEQLGILEEVLIHEATHTTLDGLHAASLNWLNAQNADSSFISTYAASSPTVEDLAESFLAWIMVRQCEQRVSEADSVTIAQSIPNRLAYLDNQGFDMYPMCVDMNVSATNEIGHEHFTFSIYPNPSSDWLNIESEISLVGHTYTFIDYAGKVLLEGTITNENMQLDLSHLSSGAYWLRIGDNMSVYKVMKY